MYASIKSDDLSLNYSEDVSFTLQLLNIVKVCNFLLPLIGSSSLFRGKFSRNFRSKALKLNGAKRPNCSFNIGICCSVLFPASS